MVDLTMTKLRLAMFAFMSFFTSFAFANDPDAIDISPLTAVLNYAPYIGLVLAAAAAIIGLVMFKGVIWGVIMMITRTARGG